MVVEAPLFNAMLEWSTGHGKKVLEDGLSGGFIGKGDGVDGLEGGEWPAEPGDVGLYIMVAVVFEGAVMDVGAELGGVYM
jgi:hypothetical protein